MPLFLKKQGNTYFTKERIWFFLSHLGQCFLLNESSNQSSMWFTIFETGGKTQRCSGMTIFSDRHDELVEKLKSGHEINTSLHQVGVDILAKLLFSPHSFIFCNCFWNIWSINQDFIVEPGIVCAWVKFWVSSSWPKQLNQEVLTFFIKFKQNTVIFSFIFILSTSKSIIELSYHPKECSQSEMLCLMNNIRHYKWNIHILQQWAFELLQWFTKITTFCFLTYNFGGRTKHLAAILCFCKNWIFCLLLALIQQLKGCQTQKSYQNYPQTVTWIVRQ